VKSFLKSDSPLKSLGKNKPLNEPLSGNVLARRKKLPLINESKATAEDAGDQLNIDLKAVDVLRNEPLRPPKNSRNLFLKGKL